MSRKSVLCNLFPNDLEVVPCIFHAQKDNLFEEVSRLVKPIAKKKNSAINCILEPNLKLNK